MHRSHLHQYAALSLLCMQYPTHTMNALKKIPKIRTHEMQVTVPHRSWTTWFKTRFIPTTTATSEKPVAKLPRTPLQRTWRGYFQYLSTLFLQSPFVQPHHTVTPQAIPTIDAQKDTFRKEMLSHIRDMRHSFYSTEYTKAWYIVIKDFKQFINLPIPHQRDISEPIHEKTVLQIALEMLLQYRENELYNFIKHGTQLPQFSISDSVYQIRSNAEQIIRLVLDNEGNVGPYATQTLHNLLMQANIIRLYEKRAILYESDDLEYFFPLLNTIQNMLKAVARTENLDYEAMNDKAHKLVNRIFSYHLLKLPLDASLPEIEEQYKKIRKQQTDLMAKLIADPTHIAGDKEQRRIETQIREFRWAYQKITKHAFK